MADTIAQLFMSTNFSETAALYTASILEREGSALSKAIARDIRTDLESARAQRDKYQKRARDRGETVSRAAVDAPAAPAAPSGEGAAGGDRRSGPKRAGNDDAAGG